MNAEKFLREVRDDGDRQVTLQYAALNTTFYVRRIGKYESTVATDDVVEALRRNGVRIIGIPVLWSTRFPVFCAVCDNIVGASVERVGPIYACDDCAADVLGMTVEEFKACNPAWLVNAVEAAKEYYGC